MAALVDQLLLKEPGSRPSAADVARRLAAMGAQPIRPGLSKLQQAHHDAVIQQSDAQSRASRAESAKERQERLFDDARHILTVIGQQLRVALSEAAPSIVSRRGRGDLWTLQLGNAPLRLSAARPQYPSPDRLPFEVVAYAALTLEAPGTHGYRGRSHSLWYCDAEQEGLFSWYEMAFMRMALVGPLTPVAPFALPPDEGAPAIGPGVEMVQLAWNLRRLVPGELDDFIARWGDWMASAYGGAWARPMRMPEEQPLKNWRGG